MKLFTKRINIDYYTFFFMSNTSISNTRLKLAKNQVNAKQHTETERFEAI